MGNCDPKKSYILLKKMSVKQIVEKLKKEINERNRKDAIDNLEEMLSENVEELSKNEKFFYIPLKNIFSVISKVNFNSIDESDNGFEILQNIIKNTINAHYEEKETLLILQNIDFSQLFLSYEKIISLFGLFTNCQILQQFCNLHNEKQQLPEKDYEYELKQKDKEIEKLKQQMKEFQSQTKLDFQPITEKPEDFESDIFKACKEGKLTSVQWLIEKENVDKNKRIEKTDSNNDLWKDDTPIHIASMNGHLPIVQYLIEKQNVDIDIKGGWKERTPLQYACEEGHLPIVEYLISKGANVNAKDEDGNYVIHYASKGGLLPIVQYLIEKQNIDINIKGANIEAKVTLNDKDGWTPLYFASNYGKTDIVKYLVSKGANKNAKDNSGQTPYDLAGNDEIRNILK